MSGTVRARNAKFCMQIHHQLCQQKKCQIRSKRVGKGSGDLLLKFWDPVHISRTVELETSKLAGRFINRDINERSAKLGQRGLGRVT